MMPRPNWLYRPVVVPNLEILKQELHCVANQIILDIQNLTPDFHYIPRDQIEQHLPQTKIWLADLGLLDRWKYLAFITGNQGTSLPLHVDTLDWTTRSYGLNVPVLNCEQSWTVFYRAQIDRPTQEDATDPRASAWFCDPDTAEEIDRIESVRPHWINVCVPHRPMVMHQQPRILASFRFGPEVHDYFQNQNP